MTPTPTPTPTQTPTPTFTPTPTLTTEEALLKRTIATMSGLSNYRVEAVIKFRTHVIFEDMRIQAVFSGERFHIKIDSEIPGEPLEELKVTIVGQPYSMELIHLPPDTYFSQSDFVGWYRLPGEETESKELVNPFARLSEYHLVYFPAPDVPLVFYRLTFLDTETIEGEEVQHFDVEMDWAGVAAWLESEGKLDESARRSEITPQELKSELMARASDDHATTTEFWIGGDGFLQELRQTSIEESEAFGKETMVMTYSFADFDAPVTIDAPSQFEEGLPW